MSCPRSPISLRIAWTGESPVMGKGRKVVRKCHLVNVKPANQPKDRSSKGLFNNGACSTNHVIVGRSRITAESDDLVSKLIRFQQAKDISCYFSPAPINGDRYSKKLLQVGPSKHHSDPLLWDPRYGSTCNGFAILVENKGRGISKGFFFNAPCFSFSVLSHARMHRAYRAGDLRDIMP